MAIRRERLDAAPASHPMWRDPRVRAIAYQVLTLLGVIAFAAFIINNTIDNLDRQGIASGFGFLDKAAGFGIPQSLIDIRRALAELARVLGRPVEHPAGRDPRDRARHHPRLRDRAGAAVVQLAGGPPRHGLHRDHPQRTAAAPDSVLVLRGPASAAATPRQHGLFGRPVLPEQSGLLRAQADLRGRFRLGGARLPGGPRRGDRHRPLGEAPPRGDRPAVSHVLRRHRPPGRPAASGVSC